MVKGVVKDCRITRRVEKESSLLKVITFNVRTMSSSDTDHDRRVKMGQELQRLRIDIAIFQETRICGKGKVAMGSGYDLYFSGHGKHKIHGVAIAIRNDMTFKSVNQISERLMEMTIETSLGCLWHIVGAYSPTNCSDIEDKIKFFRDLGGVLS